MSGPAREVAQLGGECGAVWLEMMGRAVRILERLTEHDFQALRCIADGEIVVSAYLVLEVGDVVQAARGAAPFYPHIRRLEVQGVRVDLKGAVVRHIVTFTAQAAPSSSETGPQKGAVA